MFGVTFEKLLVVGLLAAVLIGPRRLPAVVAWIASLVRGLRRSVDAARLRAATELGVPADAAQWRALDPRQYDPRRIIAEALAAPSGGVAAPPVGGAGPDQACVSAEPRPPVSSALTTEHPTILSEARAHDGDARVATRRVRAGSAAHPRWIDTPDDDGAGGPSPGVSSSASISAPTDGVGSPPSAAAGAPTVDTLGR